MHYLMLWSGDIAGMTKTRIAAIEQAGVTGHYWQGKPYGPNIEQVRQALPYRLRAAFDRAAGQVWFSHSFMTENEPATMRLYLRRKTAPVVLYFQPCYPES